MSPHTPPPVVLRLKYGRETIDRMDHYRHQKGLSMAAAANELILSALDAKELRNGYDTDKT